MTNGTLVSIFLLLRPRLSSFWYWLPVRTRTLYSREFIALKVQASCSAYDCRTCS